MKLNDVLQQPRSQQKPAAPTPCGTCGQVKAILQGFGGLAYARIMGEKPRSFVIRRADQCRTCPYRTWLFPTKWAVGMIHKNLPVNHIRNRGQYLFCSQCGCCIEAKIRVAGETCPEGRW